MRRLAYALAGMSIAVFAAMPAVAGSVSSTLTVTVTVVEPGTLGGTNLPTGAGNEPEDTTRRPTPPGGPEASSPRPSASPPAR